MQGYDVITFDDHKAGTVVGREGQFLIVEHGAIFKHRRPLPESFATVDQEAQVVRATVSRDVLESAPQVEHGALDEQAAAEHYGLVDTFEEPDADSALSAEQEALDARLTPGAYEHVDAREHVTDGAGPNDIGPPSPGIAGGDRRRDAGA